MAQNTINEVEMVQISNGNDGAPRVNGQNVPEDEPDGFIRRGNGPEAERLLGNEAVNGSIAAVDLHRDVEAQKSFLCRVRDELAQKVCGGKVPLWVVLVLLSLLIVTVVLVSVALCRAIQDDADDKFDSRLLDVSRSFSGRFLLPNLNLTRGTENETGALATELHNKLDVLYRDSPALGRYYSSSQVQELSNDPVWARFRLTFRMPSSELRQLSRFTLSRGMVYNVLRQFLFDQEEDQHLTFIEPSSLHMSEQTSPAPTPNTTPDTTPNMTQNTTPNMNTTLNMTPSTTPNTTVLV